MKKYKWDIMFGLFIVLGSIYLLAPAKNPPKKAVTTVSAVDAYYNSNELTIIRKADPKSFIDSCDNPDHDPLSFKNEINYYVYTYLREYNRIYLGPSVKKHYMVTGRKAVALTSHPLCMLTPTRWKHALGPNKAPSETLSKKWNNLTHEYNGGGILIKQKFWERFFSCLAYSESLSTVGKQNSLHPGVLFYNDSLQKKKVSQTNIGIYQFSPSYRGNIYPCIRQWNQDGRGCKITNLSDAKAKEILSSPQQSFNIFCGVTKILQMFHIQVNTTNPAYRDRPRNIASRKKQCVHPFWHKSKAYNHFGPLQNSTGKNLDKFLSCLSAGK